MTSINDSKNKFVILDNIQSEKEEVKTGEIKQEVQVKESEVKHEERKEEQKTPEEFKNHKLIKMKAHNYYYCKDCNEVIKEDGHLLETGIFHGIKKD